jgi:hypothetical protein
MMMPIQFQTTRREHNLHPVLPLVIMPVKAFQIALSEEISTDAFDVAEGLIDSLVNTALLQLGRQHPFEIPIPTGDDSGISV